MERVAGWEVRESGRGREKLRVETRMGGVEIVEQVLFRGDGGKANKTPIDVGCSCVCCIIAGSPMS